MRSRPTGIDKVPVTRAGDSSRMVCVRSFGTTFDQAFASELSDEPRLLFLCGRYEGCDERIRIGLQPEEVSIGDYVLTGGERADDGRQPNQVGEP